MTKDLLVAKRYAKALFEIAKDLHKDEEIEAELESISLSLRTSPEVEKFLTNPSLTLDEKRKMFERIYQEHPPKAGLPKPESRREHELLLNFFLILFEKNRFYLIHEISIEFKRIADEAQGQGVAEIRTASVLKPEALKAIVNRLEKIAGYKITVKSIIDPSVIGGVLVKVRNKIIDDTVANKIQLIKKELTKIQSI